VIEWRSIVVLAILKHFACKLVAAVACKTTNSCCLVMMLRRVGQVEKNILQRTSLVGAD